MRNNKQRCKKWDMEKALRCDCCPFYMDDCDGDPDRMPEEKSTVKDKPDPWHNEKLHDDYTMEGVMYRCNR
jgi:hypothetical protein